MQVKCQRGRKKDRKSELKVLQVQQELDFSVTESVIFVTKKY